MRSDWLGSAHRLNMIGRFNTEKELAEKGLLENQLKKISTDIASRKKQIKEILENSTV